MLLTLDAVERDRCPGGFPYTVVIPTRIERRVWGLGEIQKAYIRTVQFPTIAAQEVKGYQYNIAIDTVYSQML